MKKNKTMYLAQTGVIAAIYAALTLAIPALSYGEFQIRISEALTILPVYTPAAVPALTIGCFIANILGPYSYIDAIFGTAATLLAAICTRLTRKIVYKKLPLLSPLFPVLFNAVIIGLEINIFFLSDGQAFTFTGFIISALWVGLGELISCYVLGLPLGAALDKTKIFSNH